MRIIQSGFDGKNQSTSVQSFSSCFSNRSTTSNARSFIPDDDNRRIFEPVTQIYPEQSLPPSPAGVGSLSFAPFITPFPGFPFEAYVSSASRRLGDTWHSSAGDIPPPPPSLPNWAPPSRWKDRGVGVMCLWHLGGPPSRSPFWAIT